MFKRLICFITEHKWFVYSFVDPDGECEYTMCIRCGTYKDDGKEIADKWLNDGGIPIILTEID